MPFGPKATKLAERPLWYSKTRQTLHFTWKLFVSLREVLTNILFTTFCPLDDLKSLSEPEYSVHQSFIDPSEMGHAGMCRRRTFIYFRHRERCEYLYDLYEMHSAISEAVQSHVTTAPSDYRISSDQAQNLENLELSRKRKRDLYSPEA